MWQRVRTIPSILKRSGALNGAVREATASSATSRSLLERTPYRLFPSTVARSSYFGSCSLPKVPIFIFLRRFSRYSGYSIWWLVSLLCDNALGNDICSSMLFLNVETRCSPTLRNLMFHNLSTIKITWNYQLSIETMMQCLLPVRSVFSWYWEVVHELRWLV